MRNGLSRLDRLLLVVFVVLSLSVLVTGGLAVYLTLAREGVVVEGDVVAPTSIITPTATAVAPDELNAISQAGGVFQEYLDAFNADDLREAFQTILCHL